MNYFHGFSDVYFPSNPYPTTSFDAIILATSGWNKAVAPAILRNYELAFRSVADVVPAPGKLVMGAVYQLNNAHLQALDRYEGFPHLYIRQYVEVETFEGKNLQALIYVMTNKTTPFPPNEGYFNTILSGMKQWNLPEEYIKSFLMKYK